VIASELAPLKLNLFLHIIGRRADGYHLLQSLFVFADIGDRIDYTPSGAPLTLEIVGPFAAQLGPDPNNLVLRAARLLNAAPTGKLTLDKQVPVASGLGGGSADAAATLRLLNRLWHCGHSNDALRQLGGQLGADVPACIDSSAAYVSGIGDELAPAGRCERLPILLVNPGVATATPAVFAAYRALARDFTHALPGWPQAPVGWAKCQNDLDAAAQSVAPVILETLEALGGALGARLARMSGSGASCFAMFDSPEAASAAARQLAARHPGWWIRTATIHAPKALLQPQTDASSV
jgi:4-diphosphocytidyl-2-C-methyl-D-erythritol kinase